MRTTPNRKSQILSLGLTTSTRQSNSRLKSLKIIQHFWILPSTKATDLQRNQSLTFALISSRLKHFNIHTIVPATRRESWRASYAHRSSDPVCRYFCFPFVLYLSAASRRLHRCKHTGLKPGCSVMQRNAAAFGSNSATTRSLPKPLMQPSSSWQQ